MDLPGYAPDDHDNASIAIQYIVLHDDTIPTPRLLLHRPYFRQLRTFLLQAQLRKGHETIMALEGRITVATGAFRGVGPATLRRGSRNVRRPEGITAHRD
jgi:hypothetical protein